jgi:CRP/FNR family transcriptional regulator
MKKLFELNASILESPVFSGLSHSEADELANYCETQVLSAGEKLFSQGEDAIGMFILFQGKLEIRVQDLKDNEHLVGIVEEGEVFGEMSVLDYMKRSASCYSLEESLVLYIPGLGFREMLRTGAPAIHCLLQFILKRACSRLRSLDLRLDELFLKDNKKRESIEGSPLSEEIK